MRYTSSSMLAAALLLCGSAAQAQWTLDGAASSFFYVTSKASAVSEVNSFSGLSGSIAESGTATLAIDLTSVSTGVDVRDQRMRDIVFQVAEHPAAQITVNVDNASLNSMQAGMPVTGSYPVSVSLHGMSQEVTAELQITKLSATAVQVQLAKPLIVNAAAFGLAEAVEELRMLAGLPSINPNVVVDFTLLYRK